eukprot:scaffold71414_cov33-Tisochrysis_lutea.AAC.1
MGDDAFFNQDNIPNSEILKEEMQATTTIHIIGGSLMAMAFAGSIAAWLSHERYLTFLVLVCLAAAQGFLGHLTRDHARSWNDGMVAGRAIGFAGGEKDSLDDWHRIKEAFEDDWVLCGGGAYNASRVLEMLEAQTSPTYRHHVERGWVRHKVPRQVDGTPASRLPDQYALFCPQQARTASLEADDANAASAENSFDDLRGRVWLNDINGRVAQFALLVNSFCLSGLGSTNPWDAVDPTCYNSSWWDAYASAAPPASVEDLMLGPPEISMNAKLLFCLCELSDDYVSILREADGALGHLAYTFYSLTWVPILILFWFSLCSQDRDEYFDPDLL